MSTAELCFLSSFFRKELATFEKVFVSFVCDRGTGSYVRFLAPLPFTLIQIYTHEERKLLEEMKIVFLYFKHYIELDIKSSFFRKELATFEKVCVNSLCDRGIGSYVRFLTPFHSR